MKGRELIELRHKHCRAVAPGAVGLQTGRAVSVYFLTADRDPGLILACLQTRIGRFRRPLYFLYDLALDNNGLCRISITALVIEQQVTKPNAQNRPGQYVTAVVAAVAEAIMPAVAKRHAVAKAVTAAVVAPMTATIGAMTPIATMIPVAPVMTVTLAMAADFVTATLVTAAAMAAVGGAGSSDTCQNQRAGETCDGG